MARKYNAFYDPHADAVAWKAHELWMAGETAQDVARALVISVPQVYKAVALVARNPRPFGERFDRYQRKLADDVDGSAEDSGGF